VSSFIAVFVFREMEPKFFASLFVLLFVLHQLNAEIISLTAGASALGAGKFFKLYGGVNSYFLKTEKLFFF
jgi:hypothetical protein